LSTSRPFNSILAQHTHTPLPAVVPWVVPAPKSVYRVPVSPVVPVGKYPLIEHRRA
jgi:hypothetical protein